MTVMLLPNKKWSRWIGWMWAVMVVLGIIVAAVEGFRR
jgi:hypothetical protein